MKVALLNDTHYGFGNDSQEHLDSAHKFLDKVFFPEIKSRNIRKVVHLGDLTDRRKFVNYRTVDRLRKDFIERLVQDEVEIDFILGNHDTFYRNTNSVNCIDELGLTMYPGVRRFSGPQEVDLGGEKYLYLPWICDELVELSSRMIKNSKCRFVLGHLELSGFEYLKGVKAEHGMAPAKLGKFERVFSGHYHHRQEKGNVLYLGSQCEFTWADYDDPKGFHVLETLTGETEFVENPYRLFRKVFYDDREKSLDEVLDQDFSDLEGSIVKLVTIGKENPYYFDKFAEKLLKVSLARDPVLVEDHLNVAEVSDEDTMEESGREDTLSIFVNHARMIPDGDLDKDFLEKILVELYAEAVT